jgi:hypothetical protein
MFIPVIHRPNCGDDPYEAANVEPAVDNDSMDIDSPTSSPWINVERASQSYDDDGVRLSEGVKEQRNGAPDYHSMYATYDPLNVEKKTVAEQYVSVVCVSHSIL